MQLLGVDIFELDFLNYGFNVFEGGGSSCQELLVLI